jgi:hypothetical protein
VDDSFYYIRSPFDVPFLGSTYRDIFVGTNGYITFASGSTTWSSLGALNPPQPTLFIFGADPVAANIVYAANSTYLWIRFEGYHRSFGPLTAVYEVRCAVLCAGPHTTQPDSSACAAHP